MQSIQATDPETTTRAVMAAMRDRDFETFGRAIAPDVVLHSPITGRFTFEGRDAVLGLIRQVREAFEDFRPLTTFGEGDTRAVMFEARVHGEPLQGLDVLTFDAEGRISEFRVFMRPLPSVTTLMAELSGEVLAPAGRVRVALAGPPTRLQAALARTGDRMALGLLRRAFSRPG